MRRRAGHRKISRLALLLAAFGALATGSATNAAECGDDVSHERIACSCGDVLVSDTRLRPGDPVVSQRCLLEGLIVRAAPTAESIRLDMGGLAIVGRGYGVGIRVDAGGSDGAVIVGGPGEARGEIAGFSTGIDAAKHNAISRLERLRVRGNRSDGVRLRTDGTVVVDVESSDNGQDGFLLTGSGGRLQRVHARRNRANGIHLRSSGVHVVGEAVDNHKHGIVSDGKENDIGGVVARRNGQRGVVILGPRQRFDTIVSESNGLADVLPRIVGREP
jgi:hypothetical protein